MKKTKELDNNISEIYCLYDACVLLKDKGFDVFCEATYTKYLKKCGQHKKGVIVFEESGILHGRNSYNSFNENYNLVSAPTQALAIQWLRKNFNLHFELLWDVDKKLYWFVSITKIGDVESKAFDMPRKKHFTPHEAIDAALIHALTKMI